MRVPWSGVAFLVALALPGRAEVTVRAAAGRVDITANASPLAEVLDRLAKQTGMKVVYEGPAPRQLVTVSLLGRSPAEAVHDLLEGQGLNYALLGDSAGTGVQTLLMTGTTAPVASSSAAPHPSASMRRPGPPPMSSPDSMEEVEEEDGGGGRGRSGSGDLAQSGSQPGGGRPPRCSCSRWIPRSNPTRYGWRTGHPESLRTRDQHDPAGHGAGAHADAGTGTDGSPRAARRSYDPPRLRAREPPLASRSFRARDPGGTWLAAARNAGLAHRPCGAQRASRLGRALPFVGRQSLGELAPRSLERASDCL